MALIRQIRRRIRAIESTRQITRAMEMIAASRIKRARERMEMALPYSETLSEVMSDLLERIESATHPLLERREEPENSLIILIAGDRGLCGAFNANVIAEAEAACRRERDQGLKVKFYVSGKKALRYLSFRGYEIAASITGFSEKPTYEVARKVADFAMQHFEDGDFDRVLLVYTRFLSLSEHRATSIQLLPLSVEALKTKPRERAVEFSYEPNEITILSEMLPGFVITIVYSAFLQSAASEIAARRLAMKNASENAENMILELQKYYNKERQYQITRELADIIGTKEAISRTFIGR